MSPSQSAARRAAFGPLVLCSCWHDWWTLQEIGCQGMHGQGRIHSDKVFNELQPRPSGALTNCSKSWPGERRCPSAWRFYLRIYRLSTNHLGDEFWSIIGTLVDVCWEQLIVLHCLNSVVVFVFTVGSLISEVIFVDINFVHLYWPVLFSRNSTHFHFSLTRSLYQQLYTDAAQLF